MKQSLAVIFGGVSSEHEISLLSSFSILSHLDREKYDVHMLGITRAGRWLSYEGPLERIKDGSWEGHASCRPAYLPPDRGVRGIVRGDEVIPVDVVFPVLHGVGGEDGTIQGLFEMAGLPYVGCGVAASANCMDKALSKQLFAQAGLPQCPYLALRRSEAGSVAAMADRCERELFYPMFVKPSNTGSSIGIGKAKSREELEAAIETALRYSDCVIVEKCVDAREIEVAVMGNREPAAACCGEILPAREFYDFSAKYEDENSRTVIPADLPHALSERILETAVRAYRAAGCEGLARVDFFIDRADGKLYLNEINTLPGFTNISMFPKLFMATGYSYAGLLDRLIELAHERAAL